MSEGGEKGQTMAEYAQLKVEHAELNEKIAKLEETRILTPEAEMEVKKLKKKKLALKDKMERLVPSK